MNNFVFYSPTEFVFGKDTEMQVGALAGKYGARKVMIVYGGGSVLRSGLLDRVKQSLQKAGIRYCEMGGVQPNPVDTKVYEGIEICRREQADLLLPVGGGSVIDTAKAIAAGVPYEGNFWDFFIGKAKVTEGLGQLGDNESGYPAKAKLACAGIVAPCLFHYESGIDLYIAAFSDGLRHCRYDGAYHGTLFY